MNYSRDYWLFHSEHEDGIFAVREFMVQTGLCNVLTEEAEEQERARPAEVREHFNNQSITVREASGWGIAFDPKTRLRDALLYPEECDPHEHGTSLLEKMITFSEGGSVLGILPDRTSGKGGILYYTNGVCRRRKLSGNLTRRGMLFGHVPYVLHALPSLLEEVKHSIPESAKQILSRHLVIIREATGNIVGSTHAWLGIWTHPGRKKATTDEEAFKIHAMRTLLPFLESFHNEIESFYRIVLVPSEEAHSHDTEPAREKLLESGYALQEALSFFAEQMKIHTKGSELLEEVGPPLLAELSFGELDWGSAAYCNAIVHQITEYLYMDTIHEGEFTERMPYIRKG